MAIGSKASLTRMLKVLLIYHRLYKRSNEVKITERAVRLELSLQHRPDAILNLGGLLDIPKHGDKLGMEENISSI